jgi:hypothetical protein
MFQIGFKSGVGFKNSMVKFGLHNPITHCELNFSDGKKGASWSNTGTGIFDKELFRTANEWQYFTLPYIYEAKARAWLESHQGKPYNWPGVWGGIIFKTGLSGKGYTCGEACYLALKNAGMPLPNFDAQTLSPGDMLQLIEDMGYRVSN